MKASRLVPRKARQIARGWLKPSKEEAARLAKLAEKKASKAVPESSRIVKDNKAKLGFRVEKFEQARYWAIKNEALSRIAATTALDAVGIGRSKRQKQLREKILRLARRISSTQTQQLLKKIDSVSASNTLQRIKKEMEKELGKARARLFYTRYTQVLRKMERQEAKT